jgi:hypothetical protein
MSTAIAPSTCWTLNLSHENRIMSPTAETACYDVTTIQSKYSIPTRHERQEGQKTFNLTKTHVRTPKQLSSNDIPMVDVGTDRPPWKVAILSVANTASKPYIQHETLTCTNLGLTMTGCT